jgi:predicted nucleic acid-binding protein
MPLLVSDSNIFIDFDVAGLLPTIFKLEEEIVTPDLLFEDELRERHEDLLDLGLRLLSLTPASILRMMELAATYPEPGRIDLSALALAQQEGCPLVTGDQDLRRAALAEGTTVHGSLWLGERMVLEGLIPPARLRQAFEVMRDQDRRLPWKRVEKILARLERG